MTSSQAVDIRPLLEDDVAAAAAVGHESLREAGLRYGWTMAERTPERAQFGEARIRHLLATDPDGAWVAERDGEVVGTALALRRGPLWFLSLLTVALDAQGQGVGARLLTAAERIGADAPMSLICASSDPKALRRYALAGHALLPAYTAKGTVDRSLLPAVPDVREGSWDGDRELVEAVGTMQRGTPYGPDLDFYAANGTHRLLVTDRAAGPGFAVVRVGDGPVLLAAARPEGAADLLWASLAEAEGDVELDALTADQQWAVEVALAARLSLTPGGESVCVRGALGPLSPYLPSGLFG